MKSNFKTALFAVLSIFAWFFYSNQVSACSVCGDDLYLYGNQYKIEQGRFSITVENRYFTKKSGLTAHDEEVAAVSPKSIGQFQSHAAQHSGEDGEEKLREYRPVISVSYGATENLTLSVSTASTFKRVEEATDVAVESRNTSGLGDLQIGAMWNRRFGNGMTRPYSLGLLVSIKAPTGKNNKLDEGERIDEHAQPGTGSWDLKTGLGLAKIGEKYSAFISFYYRVNGTNNYEYHFGNAYLFNVGLSRNLGNRFEMTSEVNGRYAKRDEDDGESLPNTGGTIFYLTPGLRYHLIPNVGLVSSVQIPVINELYEEQHEGAVFNFTIRYDLL